MLTIDIETMDALDLGLLVHSSVPPSDPDWDRIVDRWGRFGRRIRAAGRQPCCLVVSRGGEGPNARQRRPLDEINAELRPRVAVATASSMARGIVTAISWFGHTDIRAYQPQELEQALAFLGIPASKLTSVEGAIAAVTERLVTRETGT